MGNQYKEMQGAIAKSRRKRTAYSQSATDRPTDRLNESHRKVRDSRKNDTLVICVAAVLTAEDSPPHRLERENTQRQFYLKDDLVVEKIRNDALAMLINTANSNDPT